MRLNLLVPALILIASPALAQQADPAKLGSVLRQQRDMANDNVAACSVAVSDLQAKVADLEKQLAAAKQPAAEAEAAK
jgi:phage shock protein A